MSAEVEVVVDTEVGEVRKKYLSRDTVLRFAREAFILELLADSPHAPVLKQVDYDERTITTEYVAGQSFGEIFSLDDMWSGTGKEWAEAAPLLAQYVAAEQDLLERGVLYRDMSPGHLIFTADHAVLVDHEESLVNEKVEEDRWYLSGGRGRWQTMAPEEFRRHNTLTKKTAAYRTATLAHVALTGRLPITHPVVDWRKRHAPRVSTSLPKAARRVFRDALDAGLERRYASPADFFDALTSTFENTV